MLTLISFIVIIIALAVILAVIIKKFPALAILDVANVPGEKEAKFKEQIIKARVDRDVSRLTGWFGRFWLEFSRRWHSLLQTQQANLKKIKASYAANLRMPWQEKQKRLQVLAGEAQEAIKKEDNGMAEEKLMEIINLDRKNLLAFVQLADLYTSQRKWLEARQTYEYALKLAKHRGKADTGEIYIQEIYFSLAGVDKEAEDLAAALENTRNALDLEPNSPRYLDLIIDLSIMRKDKDLAMEFWNKLATVNPENQKLEEWKEKIENL
jgi:Tfp pilus assembly protein PilF